MGFLRIRFLLDIERQRDAVVTQRPSERPAPVANDLAMSTPDPDRELFARFVAGDAAAFAVLVRRHQSQVYGYLCRCGVPSASRDDLFQEIFLRVNQAAPRFDAERPFKPWLFAIAVNGVRTYFRKRRRIDRTVLASEPQANEPTGDQIVAAHETATWMTDAIATLPMRQREVLLLVGIERMPVTDVAQTLGIPQNTVKTLLRRGRLTLAKKLATRDARAAREHKIVGSV